jgi:SMC interacting uncharacterized protein involved in chromosome segregation
MKLPKQGCSVARISRSGSEGLSTRSVRQQTKEGVLPSDTRCEDRCLYTRRYLNQSQDEYLTCLAGCRD